MTKITRALLSVSDKTGLVDFARDLAGQGVEILSTGGTARTIAQVGISVKDVSNHTGFPEMMEGRVKTLHPKVHGGLLARRGAPDHMASAEEHGIGMIDLLVVNLYPFEETVAAGGDYETCVENIDIGGPAMIRAAAKNHEDVTVVVDVADYARISAEMASQGGGTTLETRKDLAAKAYARTAAYDAAISNWFMAEIGQDTPSFTAVEGTLKQKLRYGENPHQSAAFYVGGPTRAGVASAAQIQGRELSYNNLNDTDAAFELVSEMDRDRPCVAIIKHANPCGVAYGADVEAAYRAAYRCDTTSAFGGIVAVNRALDEAAARVITEIFTEVVIAPGADDAAKAVFARKKNLRLLLTGGLADPDQPGRVVKSVAGGLLIQDRDHGRILAGDLKIVTARKPSDQQLNDLLFAFRVGKHVKSNTIVYAKNGATVGIGAGQMSRIDSARIATRKAADAAEVAGQATALTVGSVAASDAFFPFADGLEVVAEAGCTAVIQPGGSMRDDDVIAAADAAGLAMVFTGLRHFRH